MRIAEVDQSGYLRARKLGKLAYANEVKRVFNDILVTSEPIELAPGEGQLIDMALATPETFQFSAIYRVESNHHLACSIGRFNRDGTSALCRIAVTNRSNQTFDDVTVTMGIRFIRLDMV